MLLIGGRLYLCNRVTFCAWLESWLEVNGYMHGGRHHFVMEETGRNENINLKN